MKKIYQTPAAEVVAIDNESICLSISGEEDNLETSASYRSTPEEYRSSLWND